MPVDTAAQPANTVPTPPLALSARDPNMLVSPKELARSYGIDACRMTLWRWEKNGQFPKALHLSERRRAYRHGDLMAWIASRPTAAGGAA